MSVHSGTIKVSIEVNKVIVLAAGKSLQLDGVNKVLIRHPIDGQTILDHVIEAFPDKEITVVVGFCAIEIMQRYPNLNYVINPNWALTNNAMSLGLALDDRPSYVLSGDIFVNKILFDRLDEEVDDLAVTRKNESRVLSAIHCMTGLNSKIVDVYQGPVRSITHPETTGIFKMSNTAALREWKRRCMQHANLFAGQLLPIETVDIASVDLVDDLIWEINTPIDYLNMINSHQVKP